MHTGTTNIKLEPKSTALKYRYFCDGCTNIAFYGSEKTGWTGKRVCNHCGNAQLEFKPENWLDLSPDEYKKVNSVL